MRVLSIILSELLLAMAAVLAYDQWPRDLTYPKPAPVQTVTSHGDQTIISWPGRFLVANLTDFDDPLLAYLTFDYYRAQNALKGTQLMLTVDREPEALVYRILVRLPNDLISGLSELAEFKSTGLSASVDGMVSLRHTRSLEYRWITGSELWRDLHQTALFNQVYAEPASEALEQMPARELCFYVRQFIRFKSLVDPRTWNTSRFALTPVSESRADRLAADIVSVADFYNIPVELFLGIGAMENNFLDAPGDLDNAVWKNHVEADDIVLQRRGRRSWILNSSAGIWQITRQSLRHAHQLFLADDRDYSRLPGRLRPHKDLDLENVDPNLLTTYAGLLLRELLDRFDGDAILAVGAYNGSVDHPNMQYADGVETVAFYAHRVIACTADLSRLANAQAAIVEEAKPERATKLVVGDEGLSSRASPP
jgi:hypothetical protein